ncbi:MAG: alpha/beta hydrolase [Hydrogenothermaceae bacterium]
MFSSNESQIYYRIPATVILQVKRLSKFLKENIKNLKAPVIFIYSEYDDLCSIKGTEYLYRNVDSEKKKFIILKDSYHIITMDNERDIVSRETINFFNEFSNKSPLIIDASKEFEKKRLAS